MPHSRQFVCPSVPRIWASHLSILCRNRDMAAQQSVLSSPELLASILIQLPQRDFLLAQVVCRLWQSIVTTKSVQEQNLYLPWPEAPELRINALLVAQFPCFFKPDYISAEALKHCLMEPNDKIEAITRRGASWRRMLPVLPPLRALRHVQHGISMGGRWTTYQWALARQLKEDEDITTDKTRFAVSDPHGHVTMGQLYDICAGNVLWSDNGFALKMAHSHKLVDGAPADAFWQVGEYQYRKSEVAELHTVYIEQCCDGDSDRDEHAEDFDCAERKWQQYIFEKHEDVVLGPGESLFD